ncbi:MAG TPA: hypothetical protein ENI05_11535 [Porticoccus sp.]|nr:hypothetical protein [Porticoccus sp.]
MSIDKMKVFEKFPASKDQTRLVQWIENKIYRIVSRRINWLLNRVISEGIELIVDGNEPGDDGNWRIIVISGDLRFQKRISGVWTQVFEIEG